ncbi:MAG: hypothetical protein ACYDA3_04425 [Gaiellaceae bacterium]
MSLDDDLARAAETAAGFADPGERVEAVLAAEPASGQRVYLCSFSGGEARTWLALGSDGHALAGRGEVREAVSIAALCEIADEFAGVDTAPRLATPAYLDELAAGNAQLGRALAAALPTIESLTLEVESAYKLELIQAPPVSGER